jgi:hypothetical protein
MRKRPDRFIGGSLHQPGGDVAGDGCAAGLAAGVCGSDVGIAGPTGWRSVSSDNAGCGSGGGPSFAGKVAGGIDGLPSSGILCAGATGRLADAVEPELRAGGAAAGALVENSTTGWLDAAAVEFKSAVRADTTGNSVAATMVAQTIIGFGMREPRIAVQLLATQAQPTLA